MISFRTLLRTTAALCAIMTAGTSLAEDGVARISGVSSRAENAGTDAGVVRMKGPSKSGVCLVGHSESGNCGESSAAPAGHATCGSQKSAACRPGMSGNARGVCHGAGGYPGTCYTPMDCNAYFSAGDAAGISSHWCPRCHSNPCQCRGGMGRGTGMGRGAGMGRGMGAGDCEDVCLFAGPADSGSGSLCRDIWHGQSMSFRNKNARLANSLFGWLIPAGCCGQGCPPIGYYGLTYADQPDYIDPRDTQQYAAHGYGMPMAVPLAPNVNYSYNYSAGIPASRVTNIGSYNPMTAPQPPHHRSW